MTKRKTKVVPPDGKTFTNPEPETAEVKKLKAKFQKLYDDECRKLHAARSLPEWAKSIEAIRLCSDNIMKIKQAAREANAIINICSDESFGSDEPHIHISKEGQAIFTCGDVKFTVCNKDLNKALGVNHEEGPINHLLDSQLIALGRAIGLQVEPFARNLILLPIRGMLQEVWYRDVEKHESDHLRENQHRRIEEYHRHLAHWHPEEEEPANGASRPRRARTASRTHLMAHTFEVTTKDAINVARGRETALLEAVLSLKSKQVTFTQIAAAAKTKMKTKQNFERIVARFIKELIAHKALKEVDK